MFCFIKEKTPHLCVFWRFANAYMDLKGEKEIPPIAFLIIIDKSGSMSDGNGFVTNLSLAKEAAVKALENLREIDSIGVLSFDDSYTWTSEFGSGADFDEVKQKILGISIGGGTSIYPALKVGAEALAKEISPLKHIILLTDGQDGHRDYGDVLSLINEEGITFSTVSIGSDADTRLLENLAERGNGRYYHTDIDTDIPRIFAQEVYLSVQSYLVDREFTPRLVSNHEIINQLNLATLPPMYGYIAATKKEFAQSILVSDSGDPILTAWQYGLGRTAAFNSDVENKWTGAYANWEEYGRLWKNIIEYTLSETDFTGLSAVVQQEGREGIITVKTDEFNPEATLSATVINEEGEELNLSLVPTSPGVYEGRFPTENSGVYSINLGQELSGERKANLNTAYVTQYSREYRFLEDGADLQSFITKVGGEFIQKPEELLNSEVNTVKSRQSFADIFLILAILLFFIDIALRRLNIDGILTARLSKYITRQKALRAEAQKEKAKQKAKQNANQKTLHTAPKAPESEPLPTKDEKQKSERRAEKTSKPTKQKKSKGAIKAAEEKKLDTNALLKKKQERDDYLKK